MVCQALATFARLDTALALLCNENRIADEACRRRSVRDIHLINWTIEEAKLLKAERPQPSDVDPVPSLDQILIWPGEDPTGRSTEPLNVPKSAAIQSAAETMPLSNDDLAAPEPKAPSPVAVSVSFSTSAAVPTERSKSTVPTAIIKPDIYVKPDSYFAPVDRDRMISLRWVLRDMRSKRLNWWPINQPDLQLLIEMEFVEMRDGIAVLTNKGERAID